MDVLEEKVKEYMTRTRSPSPSVARSRSPAPQPVTLKLRSRSPAPTQVREFERRSVSLSPDGRRETITDVKGVLVFETDSNGVQRQIYEDEEGVVTYVSDGQVVSQEEFHAHDAL